MANFNLTAETLAKALKDRSFDVRRLEKHLSQDWFEKASPEYIRSMRAFASAYQIYRRMPNATVSLGTLHKELGKQKWVPADDTQPEQPYEDDEDDLVVVKGNKSGFEAFEANRSEAFSCVALFETGTMDLSPSSFTGVMALSSGNSIYTSATILSDPWNVTKPWAIQRLVANIGKPGISMLIPPTSPRMKKADFDSWRVINHAGFSGSIDNCFDNTSIQLSFTGYESPVPGAVFHGAQDIEAKYVETLARVYDGPKWVADIDILGAMDNSLIKRVPLLNICNGHKTRPKPKFPAVAIDNWDELIDAPRAAGVVRARGNFVGRLAAAAISVQKGHPTFLLPEGLCWACFLSIQSFDDLSGGIFIG